MYSFVLFSATTGPQHLMWSRNNLLGTFVRLECAVPSAEFTDHLAWQHKEEEKRSIMVEEKTSEKLQISQMSKCGRIRLTQINIWGFFCEQVN